MKGRYLGAEHLGPQRMVADEEHEGRWELGLAEGEAVFKRPRKALV